MLLIGPSKRGYSRVSQLAQLLLFPTSFMRTTRFLLENGLLQTFLVLHTFFIAFLCCPALRSINLKKGHLLRVGISIESINATALNLGCSTMKTPFKYLGVMVGGNSLTSQAWDDTIDKLKARLSN